MRKGETPYFQDPDFSESSLVNYLELEKYIVAKIIEMKRPNYPGIDYIAKRIYEYNNCAILAVLRNPVDRFVPNFFHNIFKLYSKYFI